MFFFFSHGATLYYEGLLRTKYRIFIYPCYVAYMNDMNVHIRHNH